MKPTSGRRFQAAQPPDPTGPPTPPRPTWRTKAACRGLDTRLFFPGQGESVEEAQAICAACDVQAECAQYALGTGQRFGIWGGTTERQRRRLRADVRGSAA